jgi:PTH1 family peptidyl-tRNA hydrolase
MREKRLRLIVGLGNPGDQYRFTRHNIGFMVVDRFCLDFDIPLNTIRLQTIYGTGRIAEQPVVVAKPMTFMNRVGPAVKSLADVFSLDAKDVLVVHDDIDLLFGRLKIKKKGGDGGHNGVKSLIGALGRDDFSRIRVGVGRPEGTQEVSAYVLESFDAEQEDLLNAVISAARDAVETVLIKGESEAMNLFHGMKISESNIGRRL